jgi:hypothetical protein
MTGNDCSSGVRTSLQGNFSGAGAVMQVSSQQKECSAGQPAQISAQNCVMEYPYSISDIGIRHGVPL